MAQDVVNRLVIRAPLSGVVQNLQVHTVGGVVRAGEPLAELVPINDSLHLEVRIHPVDINHVSIGSSTEVRFPGFKSRTMPLILGKVRSVSPDRITDPATNEPYYLGIVEVNKKSKAKQPKGLGLAGIILNAVAILFILLWVLVIATQAEEIGPELERMQQEIQEQIESSQPPAPPEVPEVPAPEPPADVSD